jgi:exodeoxyribonuclease VII large subunit
MLRVAEALGVFDLLVIGRGGGSIEDLWAFNEELLVRAVADCSIPVISAVGHEIDVTLCDFAADVRAETPSGAAELISSRFIDVAERVNRAAGLMGDCLTRSVEAASERLDHARSRLRLLSPAAQVERGFLQLDDLSGRLSLALRQAVRSKWQRLAAPSARLARSSPEFRVQGESQRLLALWKRLQAASPASVLNRGFTLVRDEQGHPVMKRGAVSAGQRLTVVFGDGEAGVRAD